MNDDMVLYLGNFYLGETQAEDYDEINGVFEDGT